MLAAVRRCDPEEGDVDQSRSTAVMCLPSLSPFLTSRLGEITRVSTCVGVPSVAHHDMSTCARRDGASAVPMHLVAASLWCYVLLSTYSAAAVSAKTYRAAAIQYSPHGPYQGNASTILNLNLDSFEGIVKTVAAQGAQLVVCIQDSAVCIAAT